MESDHYTIVPQSWFNSYLDNKKKGDFIIHLAGQSYKDNKARTMRKNVLKYRYYRYKKNEDIRKIVLEYYNLTKSQQYNIKHEKKKRININY